MRSTSSSETSRAANSFESTPPIMRTVTFDPSLSCSSCVTERENCTLPSRLISASNPMLCFAFSICPSDHQVKKARSRQQCIINVKILGDRFACIGKRLSNAKVHALFSILHIREERGVFTRMIRAVVRRIVPMVGGHDQNIAVVNCLDNLRKLRIEILDCSCHTFHI